VSASHEADDCSCPLCTLRRTIFGGSPPPKPGFIEVADKIESELRGCERDILLRELALGKAPILPTDCAGLEGIVRAMAIDEVAWLRARVSKYRALLAEEIGRRVVATAPGVAS
jgi:hypothetical protein